MSKKLSLRRKRNNTKLYVGCKIIGKKNNLYCITDNKTACEVLYIQQDSLSKADIRALPKRLSQRLYLTDEDNNMAVMVIDKRNEEWKRKKIYWVKSDRFRRMTREEIRCLY